MGSRRTGSFGRCAYTPGKFGRWHSGNRSFEKPGASWYVQLHPQAVRLLTYLGIGKFTIADEATVTMADLGINFFLDDESLGESRSKRCVELLQELNQDVKGNWWPREKVGPGIVV